MIIRKWHKILRWGSKINGGCGTIAAHNWGKMESSIANSCCGDYLKDGMFSALTNDNLKEKLAHSKEVSLIITRACFY